MAAALHHFNSLEYVQEAKKVGISEEQAIFQANQLEKIEQHLELQDQIINDLKNKELSTKGDVRESELRLQKEIKEVELSLQKEIEVVRKEIKEVELRLVTMIKNLEIRMMVIFGGGFLLLAGLMAKGFHWV